MGVEEFLLELAETKECKKISYKRLAIRKYIGLYYAEKPVRWEIDPFMIPFRDYTKNVLLDKAINIDELAKYMISTDKSNCALFAFSTLFKHKPEISENQYLDAVAKYQVITPFVEEIDMDTYSLIVCAYIFDNIMTTSVSITEIVKGEIFLYETNQYRLTKVNGATFKKDGLLFNGKGYYYNVFTNKALMNAMDTMPAFARLISMAGDNFDILYRLDERLSMPETEYRDYTGVQFEKFYGPQFRFDGSTLKEAKTLIVHMNPDNMAKLLMVIKKEKDDLLDQPFWHIEIETLPYPREENAGSYITTFLHGMYYPEQGFFTHIDYAKNQYSNHLYKEKYKDSQNGLSIDSYTESREQHYKIWCIENGRFSTELWYKLMYVSLTSVYQKLLEEMME